MQTCCTFSAALQWAMAYSLFFNQTVRFLEESHLYIRDENLYLLERECVIANESYGFHRIFKDDPLVVMTVLKFWPEAIKTASAEIKADKEIGMAAVRLNGTLLEHLDSSLQDDEDVVLAAVQCICEIRRADGSGNIDVFDEILDIVRFASVRLQDDKPFMSKTLESLNKFFLHT